jgi:hypothetical protein
LFEGWLLNGTFHGNGRLIGENELYIGNFKDGKRKGYGEQIYENGD